MVDNNTTSFHYRMTYFEGQMKTFYLQAMESGSPNHELGTRSHNLKEVKRILVNDSQIGAEWR